MELSIRNKWVSLKGSSIVKDANENDVLKVEGKFFTFTRKKFIQDLDGNTKYTVRNKVFTLIRRKALVYDNENNIVAKVARKTFSFHDRYFIESDFGKFEIVGNILQFNYRIMKDGQEIGHIARKISMRDSFVLTIPDDVDFMFYVALVIAIDNITDQKDADSSSN